MINKTTKILNKIKKSLKSREHYALPNLICSDILQNGKISICLFICVIVTAILVVTTAYNTRLLTTQREQLILEHDSLDIEWRNLILEKNTLGNYSRIKRITKEKLQMQRINSSQENVVIQKIKGHFMHESND